MRPIQAITTCLRKSYQCSDRASRPEFWWFALCWSPVVAAALLWVKPTAFTELSIFGVWAVRVLMCFPLLAAAARRGVDAGYDQTLISLAFCGALFGIGTDEIFRLAELETANHGSPFTIAMLIISVPPLVYMLARPSKPGPNPLEASP